jgi:hypothetical protein
MQIPKKLYRADYAGEEILLNTVYENSTWKYEYETVPNRITNIQISNRACIIGNGASRRSFDLKYIKNHRGGGGQLALQTYGCNALYRDFAPHFLVTTGNPMIEEIAASGYCEDHIVYANSKALLKHPGKFYLIPQDLQYNAGTLATYLACFDGHKMVFLLGFDNATDYNAYEGTPNYCDVGVIADDTYFVKTMAVIMSIYSDVEFIRVMPIDSWRQPPEWQALPNFRQINFKEWSYLADL